MASAKKDLEKDKDLERNIDNGNAPHGPDEDESDTVAPCESCDEEVRVKVVVPRYLFTSDPDEEHQVVCYAGVNYQVKYDEEVFVPAPVADILNNAIEQKKRVAGLIKGIAGKAREITRE